MSEVLGNIIRFFKTRKIEAKVGPKIEIDYHDWGVVDDVALALNEAWKKLRVELNNNPSYIKEHRWNEYSRDGKRREELTVEIEGVVMKLRGPYEPDPHFVRLPAEPKISDEQRANEALDQVIRSTSVIWAITHCSDMKHHAFIEFLNASRKTSYGMVS